MPKSVRIGLIVVAVIVGFLVAASIIAPRLFKIDSYRAYVVSILQQQTGRRIEIGHLGLTIFPSIAFRADHVAVSNPPGFPAGDWFTARRIDARLSLDALLRRQIVISALHIDQPALNLRKNRQGVWNYQIPSAAAATGARPAAAVDPALFTLREISKVILKGGTISAANLTPGGKNTSLTCEGVSGTLQDIILTAPSTPQTGASTAAQPPPIPASSGSLEVSSIRMGPLEATKLSSPVQTSATGVILRKLQFDFYGGEGSGNVQVTAAGASPQYQGQIHLKKVDVEKLLDAFPELRGRMTGQMDSDLTFRGEAQPSAEPAAGIDAHGTVEIRKGRLPKLQLNSSLTELMRVAQIGPAKGDLSSFSSIVASWQLAQGVLSDPSIRIVGSGITVSGSGYAQLAGAGALHYHGVAELQAHQNLLTSILADFSGAAFKDGKITLPFVLEGTFQKPVFRLSSPAPAVKPAPASHTAQPAEEIRDLFNLFRSKKSPGR